MSASAVAGEVEAVRFLTAMTTILATSGNALAQPAQQQEDPISGKAALGYLATSGNTESTSANASFELLLEGGPWSHEFGLTGISATSGGDTTAEAYTFTYEANRELGERGYLFTALDWERDEFSAFDNQLSETVGYGRRLINTENHALNFEAGAGARQSERRDGTSTDDPILRTTLDYVWTVNETTEFSQDLVVDSGSSNTRTQAVSELRARLFGNVALVLSYRIKHNSEVAPGIDKTDSFTAISLEYAF
jgi:putative salt-induced outer membrane protein